MLWVDDFLYLCDEKLMNKRLIFTTSAEIVRVNADSVVYVIADGNYSTINLAEGGNFVLALQLGQIERRISELLDAGDSRLSV